MDAAVVVLAAVGGVLAGPILSTAITRWLGWRVVIPQFTGLVAGADALKDTPPRCAVCGAGLAPFGLPVIAWLASAGRCRGAEHHPIRLPYLVIELVTAALWALLALRFGADLRLVPVLALGAGLLAMSWVDMLVMRIPNRFVYGTYAAVLPAIVAVSLIRGEPGRLASGAVGCAAYFLFLFLFYLVSPRRMGLGDVRLAGLMGLVLGWLAWGHSILVWWAAPLLWIVWAAMLGSLLGTVIGVVSLVARRGSKPYPFGPSLAIGCLVVIFFAESFGLT